MKNYSSKRAKKGKIAYRTPSRFIIQKSIFSKQQKVDFLEKKSKKK